MLLFLPIKLAYKLTKATWKYGVWRPTKWAVKQPLRIPAVARAVQRAIPAQHRQRQGVPASQQQGGGQGGKQGGGGGQGDAAAAALLKMQKQQLSWQQRQHAQQMAWQRQQHEQLARWVTTMLASKGGNAQEVPALTAYLVAQGVPPQVVQAALADAHRAGWIKKAGEGRVAASARTVRARGVPQPVDLDAHRPGTQRRAV